MKGALASPSFRLAGQGVALTLGKWVSEMRVVFGSGGWPNGMVHFCTCRFAWLLCARSSPG